MSQNLQTNIFTFFSKKLTEWHHQTPRPMPWKETEDPYFIWLSEIILQQTRVAQGLPYYLKFIEKYPTVDDLANASEDEVLSDWQGLGYYSRARNLHAAAKSIVANHASNFPNTYSDIIALKGVGPYSAAAIGSFAFGLEYPVVDGNVKRVFSRFFNIEESIDESKVHSQIEILASKAMKGTDPKIFNQAIMNFGAIQCIVGQPKCENCPLSEKCISYKLNLVKIRPVRSPKKKRKSRYFHYFIIDTSEGFYVKKRMDKDIWQNMYMFPWVETTHAQRISKQKRVVFLKTLFSAYEIESKETPMVYHQTLTHRKIKGTFYRYQIKKLKMQMEEPLHLVNRKNLSNFALPKMIADYIDMHLV